MSEQNKDAEQAAFDKDLLLYGVGFLVDGKRIDPRRVTWHRTGASLPVGVPDGYALVPVEPTDEMRDAGNVHTLNRSTLFRSWRAMLAAAPTVKAEQVQCEVCHGQGEVYSGHDQHFHYFDFQPPEPIMEVCPECGGEEAPSLPAAGSADLTAVRCQCCATEYPHDSYDAGLIAGSGMCQVCDAAIPAVDLPSAAPAEQPYPHGIAEDLERSDWAPLEALQWYAAGKHFDVADGRTRIIDTGAVASNALKHASLAYLELKGDAELSELRAVLSAQQSAQPEFCCKHSYKVAKQAAWGALDLTQCKCDHNEYCEHCWPDDFREGGKWHGGFETKQSAHVSMPTDAELVEMARKLGARPELCYAEDHHEIRWRIRPAVRALVRALLNGGEA